MKFSAGFVILALCLNSFRIASGEDCENGAYLLCYSSRMFRSLLERLDHLRKPLVIFPGVEIVSTLSANGTESSNDTEDDSIIGRMANYLQHHEITIKLSDLLDTNKLMEFIGGEVEQNHPVSGRKKDENKTYMVAISLMFGKLLTILGIGSIGTLAMKALGVASMALLMTGILGLKSLYQGNEQGSHHVQYVSDGHHRRRRQALVHQPKLIPLAYRGWMVNSPVQ